VHRHPASRNTLSARRAFHTRGFAAYIRSPILSHRTKALPLLRFRGRPQDSRRHRPA
jgi:hypothetical protein